MNKEKYEELLSEVNKIPNPDNNKKDIYIILKNIINEIKEKANNESMLISKNISKMERMEQDILHAIEFLIFNAADGYKYAKLIQEIRKKRRLWKYRQKYVLSIKKHINNQANTIYQLANKDLVKVENELKNLKYTFREFHVVDDLNEL